MIRLGKIQELEIKRFTSVGAYLNDAEGSGDDVLLPKSQIPEGAKIGDIIKVFVYRDSKDRIISSTRMPLAQVGEIKKLTVISSSKIGYFLDWGMEKDLFLPFSETVGSVEKFKSYLVALYIDKSDRLAATMKVKDYLSTDAPYKENDKAIGTIYSINRDIGAFVAVDNKYDGLIQKKNIFGVLEMGEEIEVRINKVHDDGKLDLSLRERGYVQMEEDAKIILTRLKEKGGFLPLNDSSHPNEIKKELHMSKSGFKRAVGKLFKDGIIQITSEGINLKK
ncbi:S1 RNA-binding domain-containing protein [Gudongella oleilytica]|uniref:CvfB family protein n=1 Tax=Gudongella oleilytica TaxID=1582259 RepID=UPI000FF87FA1|nr:S1-like domain-containing RNA-binding protein [Gudongella oleilytica]